jgi:hypothetical protein
MARALACWFYGAGPLFVSAWGGWLTSPGITKLSSDAEVMGIESHCFQFDGTGVAQAEQLIVPALRRGRPLIFGGYSLGVTSITYLQTLYPVALLLALAGSRLGQNSAINHRNCKRSVAWIDPNSTLSGFDAKKLGFDVVYPLTHTLHLTFDFDPRVINGPPAAGVLGELRSFQEVTS